jgi:hypothetical protein
MAHQHLNAKMSGYTSWREQVGYNPQLLLTDQRSEWRRLWDENEIERDMAERAAAIFAGFDIENEFIVFEGRPSSGKTRPILDDIVLVQADMSAAELHMLATMMHESRSIVLDLDPRGGEIPGVMEPSVFGRFAKRYYDGRPENPFDYQRHDPTKRQDTYRAMRRANKARGKRRG